MPYLNDNPSKRIPQAPGPNAVRSYLAEILVSKYDTTPAAAQGIANQWQFGRVQDFCKAPLSKLSRIFGPDVGLVVFQSIREDVLADWLESNEGLVGVGCLAVSLATAVFHVLRTARESDSSRVIASLRRFLAAAGPLTLLSIVQWPNCAVRFILLIVSMVCTAIWAFVWITDIADRYKEKQIKK